MTTTNQFSYLPYQQSLLAYNKQVNWQKNNLSHLVATLHRVATLQQPFTRSNKLRTAVIKREQKNVGPRPKSVDFEVSY